MKLGGVKLNSRHHQTFAAGHDVDDDSSTAGAFKKVGPQELSSASAIESRNSAKRRGSSEKGALSPVKPSGVPPPSAAKIKAIDMIMQEEVKLLQ